MPALKHRTVTVRVPATTANLGPGFDCLGMALDVWNSVHLEVSASGGSVLVTGQGADALPRDASNLVLRAVGALFQRVGAEPPELALRCRNHIPLARGLGSSAAAIVGGLVAANALLGEPLAAEEVLALAVELEGHPDNVAPALLGGCRVVVREEGRVHSAAVPLPDALGAVVLVPDVAMPTGEARAVLPESVPLQDAVYNVGRAALLVDALATGRLELLAVATQDRLHQPARQRLFPAMKVVFRAALAGGALAVFLSGAGSSILALTRGREMTVAYEMLEAARQANVPADVKVTRPSPIGAQVIDIE